MTPSCAFPASGTGLVSVVVSLDSASVGSASTWYLAGDSSAYCSLDFVILAMKFVRDFARRNHHAFAHDLAQPGDHQLPGGVVLQVPHGDALLLQQCVESRGIHLAVFTNSRACCR